MSAFWAGAAGAGVGMLLVNGLSYMARLFDTQAMLYGFRNLSKPYAKSLAELFERMRDLPDPDAERFRDDLALLLLLHRRDQGRPLRPPCLHQDIQEGSHELGFMLERIDHALRIRRDRPSEAHKQIAEVKSEAVAWADKLRKNFKLD